MKAVVYYKYGSPDVLELQKVQKPAPKDDQVLVRVQAASINPLDWHFLRATPFFARLATGLLKPKRKILGVDIAGRVEAVGGEVKQFRPGDEVFGGSDLGGFAEFVCVNEAKLVVKPANTSFEEAAAVPVAAITALQGLRDKGKIQTGQKVLINGASGGVGTFAVQIAKSFGAEVTGVCSSRNLDMVRSIGADHAIDYAQQDFTRNGQTYDLIFCAVGNRSAADYKRTLNPKGICAIAGFTTMSHMLFQDLLLGAWISLTGSKKIGLMGTAKINKADLVFLKEILEDGKIVPVIDRQYPLGEVADAIRYLEEGHARGKVVITV
ncbi:MAG: alcohol dehydrogenase [SAR202 cluster bacterium Io17-Chloro-G9]|nr:MAG: alcohol dehydrogenase [SAR202 cluster bacterium Io17-Chloro-G9]